MSIANRKGNIMGGQKSSRMQVDSSVAAPLRTVGLNICGELEMCIERLFASADDYFFDAANRASNYGTQIAIFDAMRAFRQEGESISAAFASKISTGIRREWSGARTLTHDEQTGALRPVKFDEITIQSDAQAEISTAKSIITSRAHALYGNDLRSFIETVNGVLGLEQGCRRENPLDVRSITNAFGDAIEALSLENAPLRCMLRLFEREVSSKLGGVYARALAQLEENGVRIVNSNATTSPQAPVGVSPVEAGPANNVGFRALQQYLVTTGPAQASMGASAHTGVPRTSVTELMTTMVAAQDLFHNQIPDNEPVGPSRFPNLGTFLLGLPEERGGFQNAGIDELHTLRFISELFGHIFNNPDISLASKNLVARLQFPVLTLAIVEKPFFDDATHPAREFVNRLAQDGIGWPNSGPALSQHRMYQAAEALVQRIVDDLPCNHEIFQHSLKQWSELMARTSAYTDGAERRVNEAALGQARLKAAKRIVTRLINESVGIQLPPALIDFIQGTLFHALVVTCIKFGTESTQWKKVVETYTDLVGACRSDECEQIGRLPTRDLSAFMARIEQSLEPAVNLDNGNGEELAILKGILLTIIDAAKSGKPVEQSIRFAEMKSVTDTTDNATTSSEVSDPLLERLVPGTWVEIDNQGDGESQRCRLVVIVDQTQTYVFSNDLGQKAYESSAVDILGDLQSRRIKILSEQPVVDQAMQKLVENLRS
ncbi:MAG: hypothetical protein ACI9UU_001178 [Candidatus Azotimanducaceae bacterium]|jgi:hypothetical protein